MRQVRAVIGDLVDIEEDRAGNVARDIFLMRVAAFAGHMKRAVDDGEIRRAEIVREPLR